MENKLLPGFMEGTFVWSRRGYFFASLPPVDLSANFDKTGINPWIVLASALEHVKLGHFAALDSLKRRCRPGEDLLFVRATAELLGNVATIAAQNILLELMESSDGDIRAEACSGACMCGNLELVPAILKARRSIPQVHLREEISLMLSLFLEERAGDIQIWATSRDCDYDRFTLLKAKELGEAFGKLTPIWRGQRYDVIEITRHMLEVLYDSHVSLFSRHVRFKIFRSRFEAATGIDCTECFRDDKLQVLVATSLLEDFLSTQNPPQYQSGVRYFFGHRISW